MNLDLATRDDLDSLKKQELRRAGRSCRFNSGTAHTPLGRGK